MQTTLFKTQQKEESKYYIPTFIGYFNADGAIQKEDSE